MKKSIAIFFLALYASAAYADSIVTVLSPSGSVVSEKEQILEFKVEDTAISAFQLVIEPFLQKDDNKLLRRAVRARDGFISEKITLSPGLNLVHILSSNNTELMVLPLLLASHGKNPLNNTQNWGEQSNILFTAPIGAVTHVNPLNAQGASTDPEIKSVDIIAFDASDLLPVSSKQRISYQRAWLERQKFGFTIPLTEGLNIVLAKPHGIACGSDSIQIRSIIYDKNNPAITINEPEFISDTLIISGKTTNTSRASVNVSILAFAEHLENPGKVSEIKLINQPVKIQKDGAFSIQVPWNALKEKYTIKPRLCNRNRNSTQNRVIFSTKKLLT